MINKFKSYDDMPRNFTGTVEWPDGRITHHKDGKLHNSNGPAIERKDGTKDWFLDGKYVWFSTNSVLNIKNDCFYLSETKHKNYPEVKVLTWIKLDQNGVGNQFVISGMEGSIIK